MSGSNCLARLSSGVFLRDDRIRRELSRGLAVDVDGMDGRTREYSSSAAGMG